MKIFVYYFRKSCALYLIVCGLCNELYIENNRHFLILWISYNFIREFLFFHPSLKISIDKNFIFHYFQNCPWNFTRNKKLFRRNDSFSWSTKIFPTNTSFKIFKFTIDAIDTQYQYFHGSDRTRNVETTGIKSAIRAGFHGDASTFNNNTRNRES